MKNTTRKASPTPTRQWERRGTMVYGPDNGPGTAPCIAECRDIQYAALIVRAVNAHQGLVEAAREALEALDHWEGKNETSDKLRAALKLAGEGE